MVAYAGDVKIIDFGVAQGRIDSFRTAPGGLSICKNDGNSTIGALDNFKRVAAFRCGVFVDLGGGDLDFHALILLWEVDDCPPCHGLWRFIDWILVIYSVKRFFIMDAL